MIHMESYFDRFQHGMEIDTIVDDITNAVHGDGMGASLSLEDILDFNQMKDKIVLRIVNTQANQELLDTIPHKSWMDLSVIYYLLLGRDEGGQTTTLISNKIIREWGVGAEELYNLAHENTKRLLPSEIRHISVFMSELMSELLSENPEKNLDTELMETLYESDTKPMYVLSNSMGLYGAGCMLPGLGIEDFANELGTDLIVLPSSVHEVLLVPFKSEEDIAELSVIVKSVNQTQVPAQDQLSDSVYFYSRDGGMKQLGFGDSIPGKG